MKIGRRLRDECFKGVKQLATWFLLNDTEEADKIMRRKHIIHMLFEANQKFPLLSIVLISRCFTEMSWGLASKFQEYIDKSREFKTVNVIVAARYFSLKDLMDDYITPPMSLLKLLSLILYVPQYLSFIMTSRCWFFPYLKGCGDCRADSWRISPRRHGSGGRECKMRSQNILVFAPDTIYLRLWCVFDRIGAYLAGLMLIIIRGKFYIVYLYICHIYLWQGLLYDPSNYLLFSTLS